MNALVLSGATLQRLAFRLRAFAREACIGAGIDTAQPLPGMLWSLLFRMPPPWLPAQRARIQALFPHVDFSRLRGSDLIRLPLQTIWLLLALPRRADVRASSRRAESTMRLKAAAETARQALRSRLSSPRLHGVQRGVETLRSLLAPDAERLSRTAEYFARHSFWSSALLSRGAFVLAGILAAMCITTPFSMLAQATFVVLLWAIAMMLRRIPGQVGTLLLIVLSVTASTRYLWWRWASTLNWDEPFDLMWGMLLIAAEIYTWFVLLLGYAQTAWPLKREPAPLPRDTSAWPTVDVFIPSYNEPLKVVKPTVYAAMGIDWPADKLNIYILDDGRREEFRHFAEEIGIGYRIRGDNRHAKAGNINAALKTTQGEFIAIFDCDHIPTRSFLQVTMGLFLRDSSLALVQTPHHFFSPDPFERNLGVFRHMPNEGELFYGLIQDGNDLWNATFFCGSCAVIRRKPLEEVGGIAVETVTEDAHTALKMQRRGYNSAYLNIAQAAGLATESLSAHIGQRIRWARGMAQIFRIDNPFFGKGLTFMQRVCYSNAMLHFLNGGPRLVFLTAPLAFLIFHAYVIYAPALSVILYVLPHMAHANLANSRMQGGHRRSFWAEVYETVLAWYITRPTLVALIDPGKGKFNVTAKGGLVDKAYFDWGISLPNIVLIALNLLGFTVGIWRLGWGPADEIGTTALNLFWTFYNLLVLGAAIAVAAETKQVRLSHRVKLKLPAALRLSDGRLLACHTEDFSEGGAALVVTDFTQVAGLRKDEKVHVLLKRGEEEFAFPALVTALVAPQLRLRWNLAGQEQEIALVQCTFARADAWVSWADGRQADRPLESLGEVLKLGFTGYRRLGENFIPILRPILADAAFWLRELASLLPRTPVLPTDSPSPTIADAVP